MNDSRGVIQRLISRAFHRARDRPKRPPGASEPVFRLPADHIEAAQRLATPEVVASLAYLKRADSVPWDGLHPAIIDFQRALIKEFRRRGIPMFLVSAVRSDAEQNELFRQGVTKARAGQSPHNHGMAVDIVHYGRFWNLTRKEWAVIGLIGKEVARKRNVKIQWGGDWKFFDPAHWELADWSNRLRNGE